jgi:hypothetical protein
MNDRPCSAAHVIADLIPVLDDKTCRQLRAMLADDLATHDALSPVTHSLIGLTTVIAARQRVPSVIEYARAQAEHPAWPHSNALIRRYGTWLHAVSAATHFMSDKPKKARPPRATQTSPNRNDCVNAILRCQLAIGDWPGSSEYARWRNIEADLRRRTGDHANIPPDFNAIHRHFGTWAAALRLARASSPAPG